MRSTVNTNDMTVLDDASQVYKLLGNRNCTKRFCRCTGKYKALGLNAQTSQARSLPLRPRALYFPVQNKTG